MRKRTRNNKMLKKQEKESLANKIQCSFRGSMKKIRNGQNKSTRRKTLSITYFSTDDGKIFQHRHHTPIQIIIRTFF